VYASNTVALGATAKVVGNLHYDLLEMTSGAEINGKLIHEGTKKQAAARVRPSVAESEPAHSVSGAENIKTA
jgi:cytoskeletal protein CcmA (bactofilin family)